MEGLSPSIEIAMPEASMWVELIRAAVGLAYFVTLALVLYLAVRMFTGERARKPPSWHLKFAVIAFVSFAVLLAVTGPVERLLASLAKPLDRVVIDHAPGWPHQALIGIFRSIITTLGLVLAFQLVGRVYWRWEERLEKWWTDRGVGQAYWADLGAGILHLLRTAAVLALVAACLPLYLNYFPRTRLLMDGAQDNFGKPAKAILGAIIDYIPDLGYLVLVAIIGRYSIKAMRSFFKSVENGRLTIPGFYPDWAPPTYRLLRALFLFFLLMVSFPYLPGARSEFFNGFSVFVGALVTFGSSGAIGNIVAGIVLTYTRAFRLGDMVSTGGYTGVLIGKSLLVTRLRTPGNEEITIPNGTVLSGSVMNYSALAGTDGIVLRVNAGIGYDVDWRTVHRLMIEGALATPHILHDPAPVVWQSGLGDYSVTYELRATTNNAREMWDTYSTLRKNVLEAFNRAGVEIMTPGILALRNANNLAVPVEQFPNRERPRGIAVDLSTRADGNAPDSGSRITN